MTGSRIGKNPKIEPERLRRNGQSMVEFAITLPIIILLFTGMVEFGFMLNTYLSVQDAVRATARRFSTVNPLLDENDRNADLSFFDTAAEYAIDLLAPAGDPQSRQIVLEDGRDNILISLIGVEVDEDADPVSVVSITRHSEGEYYRYFDQESSTNPPTAYSDSSIEAFLTANGAEPSDSGLLIVEIYYGYEGTLNLPWTQPFFSQDDPAMLYVSAVMPTIYTKPLDQAIP